MKSRFATFILLALATWLSVATGLPLGKGKDNPAGGTTRTAQDDAARMDGEKRFRANCGRCHTAPPKFAPRMMATIVRHMRVRATITDEDMHVILRYMTQ